PLPSEPAVPDEPLPDASSASTLPRIFTAAPHPTLRKSCAASFRILFFISARLRIRNSNGSTLLLTPLSPPPNLFSIASRAPPRWPISPYLRVSRNSSLKQPAAEFRRKAARSPPSSAPASAEAQIYYRSPNPIGSLKRSAFSISSGADSPAATPPATPR